MQIDQNKFMSVLLDKTSDKMNQLQVQVLVLESQLALAVDVSKEKDLIIESLQKEIEKSSTKKKSEFTN